MKKFVALLALLASTAFAGNNTYIQGPTLIESLSTYLTTGGSTDLYVISNTNIKFSGTSAQTVNLPDATTLKIGRRFNIYNAATANLTIKDGSAATLVTLQPDTAVSFVLSDKGSTAGLWATFKAGAPLVYQIDGPNSSVLEGDTAGNTATGLYSHAEGGGTDSTGNYSHAEGHNTAANAPGGHAEGDTTVVSATSGHSEGTSTTASGTSSHAGGNGATASGNASFAHGLGSIAQGWHQFAIGQYNVAQGTGGSYVNTDEAFILGHGANSGARKNSFSITNDGVVKLYGTTSGILSLLADPTTSSYSLTMPSAQGAVDTFLKNDGSGGLTWATAGSGSGEGAFNVIQNNPGAELGASTNWTASGGSFSVTNSAGNVGFGNYSFFWDSTGAQNVRSDSYAVPAGLYGHNCMARILYKDGDSDLALSVLDGSNNPVAGPISLPASSTFTYSDPITFRCPSSGNLKLEIKSTTNDPGIYWDASFIGENSLINLSQAELVGTMSITNCNTLFGWSSGSYADSTLSSCTYTATGRLVAPSTVVPGWSTSNGLEAGEYFVTVSDEFNLGSGQETAVTITDGTISSRDLTQYLTQGSGGGGPGLLSFNFSVPNTQATPTDFRIQAKVLAGGGTFAANATSGDYMTFSVYKFPTSTQKAISPSMSAVSWSGYHTNTGGWSTTSATYADPSAGTGVSLVELSNRNFGTVVTEGSGLPGITWTAKDLARYLVCAGVNGLTSTSADTGVQLVDGSNNLIDPGEYHRNAGNTNITSNVCGIQSVTAVGAVTTKLRLVSDGSASRQIVDTNIPAPSATIRWTITKLDQPFPAPLLVNSVVSESPGVEKTLRVNFANSAACTSDPCTINSQSGGVSSVERNGTGDYTVHISAGVFSSEPSCTFNGNVLGATGAVPTSTAFRMNFYSPSQVTPSDAANVSVICIGPN